MSQSSPSNTRLTTRIRAALLVLVGLAIPLLTDAQVPLNGKTGWTTIMYGVRGDPIDDSQAGAADTDIVGDASHGSLYTKYDDNGTAATSDDTLLFRMRIGNPTSNTNFAGVGIVGMDANGDGKIDLFMTVDGRNNTRAVLLMDPGTQANISPSTTSTSLLPTGWLPNNGIYSFNSGNYLVSGVEIANDPHWNGDNDLDDDGKQDAFVTWRVPMSDLATVLAKPSPLDKSGNYGPRGATGIAGYDQNTVVRYVNFTQTQHGPINGDLNGVGPSYDKNGTFASLGAFTAPMSAANPVSASDKVTIAKPVDATGYINASEDDAFTVTGTATAGGWVKLTVSDTDAGTPDLVVWVQADGTGAWSATGLAINTLAEGDLSFTADLVTANASDTLVTGATSDFASAIHDTIPPEITVDALATSGKPVISGTSVDIPAGSSVTVSVDPNGDGDLTDLVTYSAIVGAGGVWSVDTASVSPSTGSITASGFTAYASISATGYDIAGNSASALAITKPTVISQITNDTTPAISGTWGGSNGGSDVLSVTVNGATYTEGANLVINGKFWTLTIPGGAALSTSGSPFDVTATTTRGAGSADDPTAAELQIVSGPAIAITSSNSQSNPKPTITGTSTIINGFITLVIDLNNDGNLADAVTYSVSTDASGNWTLTTGSTMPLSGTYPLAGVIGTMGITAIATDSNGAQASATQALTVSVRSLSITSVTSTAVADTTGTVNNADTWINRREDDAITVSGFSTNAVGLTVTVTAADSDSGTTNPSGTATVQADGSWSVTGLNLSALRDGYLTFTAAVTGATASNTAYIHDATVPVIRFTTPSTIDKNGGVAGGAISGASDLVAGTVITMTLSSGGDGTATVDANGDWSYIHPSTSSGSSITATATPAATGTDLAGNKPAAAISATFSTSASITLASNAIAIGTIAGDNIIVDSEAPSVVISGTSTLAAGTTVTVNVTKSDGTAVVGPLTTTVTAGGTWTIAAQNFSGVSPNGTLIVTATATSTYTYTDVALPELRLGAAGAGSAPTVTITSAGDANLSATEDDAVTISGTTTNVTNGGTVSLTISDTDGGTANVLATATVSAGTWTTTVPVNLSSLAEGTLTIDASVTANSQTATDSAVVNHDTIPPLLTFTAGPNAATATPVISGTTDLVAGAAVTLLIDADNNGSTDLTYLTVVQAGGTWSVNTASATPATGTFPASGITTTSKVTASGTDLAGNSNTLIATTIVAITNDSGLSSQDFLTSDSTLIFSGRAEPGSTVDLSIGGSSIGSTAANGSGVWSYDYTGTTLPAAIYALTAVATKSAGLTASATQDFTVDITGPAVAISSITDDTGIAGDFETNDTTLIFNGTATSGSAITVTLRDSSNNIVFSVVVAATGGNWSVDRTGSILADDTYSLSAIASDAAGNSTTALQAVIVDTDATIAITTNASTSDDTPVITGTTDIEAGRTITIEIDPNNDGDFSDAHTYTATVQVGGTWSVEATTPLTGVVGLRATGTDANGNLATASKPLTINLNAPTITITEPIGDGDLDATEDDAVVISGVTTFVPAGGSIQVSITDGERTIVDSTTAAADGSWSLDPLNLSSMANGVISVTAVYVDDTGTPYSDLATVLHDKSGVVTIDYITADTGAISDFTTSDNTLIFHGSAAANQTLLLTLSGSSGTVFSLPVTADSNGVWSYDYTGTVLPDGTYTLTADAASQTLVIHNTPPAGPVTVDAQATADTTPAITGTATVGAGEVLTVTVNGVTYEDGDGHLTLVGTNWTLNIPAARALAPASADGEFDGVYDVTATIRNSAGASLSDATSGELTISDITAPVIDLAPADGVTIHYAATSSEGAAVSLDDNANAATVVEASDSITRMTITVAGLLDGADELLTFGATTVAANGTAGAQSDITVGGVRINLTYGSSVFTIQKYNYTNLTAAEAQAIARDIQYENTATVTVGARTFTFGAIDAAGNAAAGAIATINVAATRVAQNICFCPPAKASRYGSVTLAATASSGLPVTYSVTSGPGSVAGNVLTFSGAGNVAVTASQAGDASYLAAPDKTETINVIDFHIPSNVADGWTVTYGGEDDLLVRRNSQGKAMAMQVVGDFAVSVAMTGATTNVEGDTDLYTAKYDAASGEKLWAVIHGGEAALNDEGAAVAMDSAGDVWVAGTVTNADKNTDIYVARYASEDGALLWEHTFRGEDGSTDNGHDGVGGYAHASPYQGGDFRHKAIALTPDGGVVITGFVTKGDKKMDALTLKFAADGSLAWSGLFNGTAGGTDYGQAIAVDAAGDVFVSGASVNTNIDAIVMKFDGATGARLWDKTYDGGKPDAAVNIKIDADGHPVVSGYSQRATFDFMTARYDTTDGSLIWMDLRDGPANSSDMAWDFALTDGTRPIITGTSYPQNGVYDGYTFAFNCPCSTDPVAWTQRYDGAAGKLDQFVAIGTDMFGNPIVTGYSQNANGTSDTQTVKYRASDGTVLWSKRYNGEANGNDVPRQILVDPAGNVFIAGYTTTTAGVTDSWVTRYVATEPSDVAAQVITFLQPPPQGVADFLTLNASASSGLPVAYEIVSGPAYMEDNVVGFTGMGSVTIRASQPGDGTYLAATPVERTFVVGKSRQVIVFTLPETAKADAVVPLEAESSSGLPVTYELVSGPGVVSGSSLSFTGAGAVTVRASQGGSAAFNAAVSVTRTVTAEKGAQTIAFTLPLTAFANETITLNGSTSSGLPASYEVVSGPGVVSGSSLSFTGSGVVSVRASQTGSDLNTAAPAVTRSITVKKANQAIAFTLPASEDITGSLTLAATSSSGLPVTYTITGPGVISGSTVTFTGAGKVTITARQAGNAIYNAAPNAARSVTVVLLRPVLADITLPSRLVGEVIEQRIAAALNPASFAATGLPPGVVLNRTTGMLTGAPTAAKMAGGEAVPYTVTFTASNAAGASAPVTVSWMVQPLPDHWVGTFNGVAEANEGISLKQGLCATGLGGAVSITTTKTGSFTGRVVIDTISHSMNGKLRIENGGASGQCVIKRLNCPSLTVQFSIDPETGHLTGSATDGGSGVEPMAFSAWRNCWHATNHPATALAGAYTAALELPADLAGNEAYPQGNGFGTLKITAAGAATWSGKLADGTAFTASTTAGPSGQVGVHIPLYTPAAPATAGAASGWLDIDTDEGNALAGALRWKKNAQLSTSTTRSYKNGFPAHEVSAIGGQYLGAPIVVPPSEGTSAANNATLTFSGGGLEAAAYAHNGEIRQAFRLKDGRTVVMPTTLALNPAIVRLTLNASTGLINGTFTLKDADPTDTVAPIAVLTRTVTYTGVMVPALNQGVGHFILPQLPSASPATTLSTTPQLSGQVLLEVINP